MPSRQRRLFSITAVCLSLLAGCTNNPAPVDPTGQTNTLIPDKIVSIGPTTSIPLEKLVYWGVFISVAYLILDPLAPNWEIQEARFPENHIHLSLSMRRLYAGGAGEGRLIFHRRAKELMRAGGFSSYEVIEYSEGMDSSMLGAKRTVEGVIHLTKSPA